MVLKPLSEADLKQRADLSARKKLDNAVNETEKAIDERLKLLQEKGDSRLTPYFLVVYLMRILYVVAYMKLLNPNMNKLVGKWSFR